MTVNRRDKRLKVMMRRRAEFYSQTVVVRCGEKKSLTDENIIEEEQTQPGVETASLVFYYRTTLMRMIISVSF